MPSRRHNPSHRKKEPIRAPDVDLDSMIADDVALRARFRYLCESGALISQEEEAFWYTPHDRDEAGSRIWGTGGQIQQNPYLLNWCGAYRIKSKFEGFCRYLPNNEQAQVTTWREHCWRERIVCDIRTLKCRQDGMSTEATLSNLSFAIGLGGECYSHIVGNEVKNTKKMLRIVRSALTGLPYFMQVDKKMVKDDAAEGVIEINDEAAGIVGMLIQTDTAKKDEDIGRGDPSQIRHYTEVEWWYNPEGALAALGAQQVWFFPATQTAETTGKRSESSFQSMFMAGKTADPNNPGRRSFFFPWYSHLEYKKPLPRGQSVEDFWSMVNTADPELYERLVRHGVDEEQANWYVWKRQEQLDQRVPLDLFRREFPFDEDEAFLGGTFEVFNRERLATARDYAKLWKIGRMADVGRCAFPAVVPEDWKPKRARVKVVWAHGSDVGPVLTDSPFHGDTYVYELPRQGHNYMIDVDLAENKLSSPGIIESGDWTRIKVTRWTYDPRCDRRVLATVCTVASKIMGPLEAARVSTALGMIYRSKNGRTKTNFERNSQGLGFELEQKRLGGDMFEHFREDGVSTRFVEYGIQATTGAKGLGSKNYQIALLQQAIDTGVYQPLDPDEIREMGVFARDEKGNYGAPSNDHDDCVSTARLMCAGVASERRGFVEPLEVKADGGENLADMPSEESIDEAMLENAFNKLKKLPLAAMAGGRASTPRGSYWRNS